MSLQPWFLILFAVVCGVLAFTSWRHRRGAPPEFLGGVPAQDRPTLFRRDGFTYALGRAHKIVVPVGCVLCLISLFNGAVGYLAPSTGGRVLLATTVAAGAVAQPVIPAVVVLPRPVDQYTSAEFACLADMLAEVGRDADVVVQVPPNAVAEYVAAGTEVTLQMARARVEACLEGARPELRLASAHDVDRARLELLGVAPGIDEPQTACFMQVIENQGLLGEFADLTQSLAFGPELAAAVKAAEPGCLG